MSGTAPPSSFAPEGPHIFLVAVEESGDRLGGALMRALQQRTGGAARFSGVGGHEMARAGLDSLLPIDDFGIVGFTAIPQRLPRILDHMKRTVAAAVRLKPDALVVIDSPTFTLRVARKVHRIDPSIPIVDYVSPSVWAWRSYRARRMRHYVDRILALLPFEPEVHRRLGGPPCTYVGHPLIEDIPRLRPDEAEAQRRRAEPPVILAMPGSRSGEIARLASVFGEAAALVADRIGPIDLVVPTVPHLADRLAEATASWRVKPRIAVGHDEKFAAYRVARAALAKSGTTTLELAVSGVPMIAAYKVSALEAMVVRRMVRVPSYILANLVIGGNVVPEIVQEDCTPQALADALVPLIGDTPQRGRQVEAFGRLDAIMGIGREAPASRAADQVLDTIRQAASRQAASIPVAAPK